MFNKFNTKNLSNIKWCKSNKNFILYFGWDCVQEEGAVVADAGEGPGVNGAPINGHDGVLQLVLLNQLILILLLLALEAIAFVELVVHDISKLGGLVGVDEPLLLLESESTLPGCCMPLAVRLSIIRV